MLDSVIVIVFDALLIVLLVSVCVPVNVATVESILSVMVSVVAVEVNPVPPAIVNVSVPTVIVSVPVSPAIDISDDIAVVLAAVNLPCASTVNVGIAVDDP